MDIQDRRSNRKKTDVTSDFLEGLELELQGDMTDRELSELVSRLSKMPTALPDEQLITETMNRLQNENTALLPKTIKPSDEKRRVDIWTILKVVISHINLSFLWQGLIFYLAGFFLLNNATNLPKIFILPVIAAIPFLLGVISILRWFEKGIAELMMSLKFKLVWYMNASFLLTGVYCLLINTLFTFILSAGDMNWGLLTLHWCIPSIVIASIAVWLCAWVKDFLTLAGCFIALPVLCMLFYANPSVQSLMISLNTDLLIVLFAIAIVLFTLTVLKATRHIRNGGMINGTHT